MINTPTLLGLTSIVLAGTMMNAEAITIAHGGPNAGSVDIDFVDIGNTDVTTGDTANTVNGANPGVVSYEYSIGKFEVTADQWAAVIAADAVSATQAIGAAHNPPQVQAGMKRRSSPTG